MKKNTTRKKIILFSLAISFLYLLFVLPIFTLVIELISVPKSFTRLEINRSTYLSNQNEKKERIQLRFIKIKPWDLKEIKIYSSPTTILENKNYIDYDFIEIDNLNNDQKYDFKIEFIDFLGLKKKEKFEVETLDYSITEEYPTFIKVIEKGENVLLNTATIIFQFTIIILVTLTSLFFIIGANTLRNKKIILLYIFSIFFQSALFITFVKITFNTDFFQDLLISLVFPFIVFSLNYIVFLSLNILHIGLESNIPLEQAAFASLFVLSLVLNYAILVDIYTLNIHIFFRILLIFPFFYFFTYFLFTFSKSNATRISSDKAMTIGLFISLALFVLSILPVIHSIGILIIAFIYYIILNIGLEIRSKMNKGIKSEYVYLIVLIIILILNNAKWGTIGGLI